MNKKENTISGSAAIFETQVIYMEAQVIRADLVVTVATLCCPPGIIDYLSMV